MTPAAALVPFLRPLVSRHCENNITGMHSQTAMRRRTHGSGRVGIDKNERFPRSTPVSWAWLDLNLQPTD